MDVSTAVPINTEAVPGYGDVFRVSHDARCVFMNGQLLEPEPGGLYGLWHPDGPEVVSMLTADEIHDLAYGQPLFGGYTMTDAHAIYDPAGSLVPLTTVPTGWGKGEEPAVELHYLDAAGDVTTGVFTIADLVKGNIGQTAILGRTPGYRDDDE